ncbi:MAG: MFS transporter, partial [Bacteroidales bacterium]
MKYVETGNGQIPFISLIGILSISLVVNLPGLAISPLMDKLDEVFPHVSKLEIQLLTILPNLFIIPFVLWSGKLSVSKNKIGILLAGLSVYVLSAIFYFFARSMMALIIISCLLGIGCGLVIPLAAGLIAEYFSGHSRMKQLGIKSGIANFTLIFATMLVGWLGNNGWHLPFLVYLTPVIPLLLSPFISAKYIEKHRISDALPDTPNKQPV